LALIYPNPMNPERYVVLNSGFTYREYDYLNNARQVPKLPDWAVFDLNTPPNSQRAGAIADADFFGEQWQLLAPHDARDSDDVGKWPAAAHQHLSNRSRLALMPPGKMVPDGGWWWAVSVCGGVA